MDIFKEVYNILSNIEIFNMQIYNRLIKKYDKEIVDKVIDKLLIEDNDNVDKFIDYLDNYDFFVESKMDLLNYSIYLSDLKRLECFSFDKNKELLVKISNYIKDMEIIFNKCGCEYLYVGKKVPWIYEKVEYCLNNCNDVDILNDLNNLYNDYCRFRDQIVEGNLRFVLFKVLEYCDDMTMIEEMIQYGNIGLIRAIEKFDISKDVSFLTYAGYWVMQSITRGIKSIKYSMRMPMHVIYKNSLLIETKSKLSMEKERNISHEELAGYMGISLLCMESILNAFLIPVSLDDNFVIEYEDDDFVKLENDHIVDENVNVYEDAVSLQYRNQLLQFLSDYLLEREFRVLNLYYGFNGKNYTDKEIAKEMGISQQRVGQIRKDALIKLRRKKDIRDIVIV